MINRRRLMFGLGGATAALAVSPGMSHAGINWQDDDERFRAIVKMRGCTDDRLCMGWVTGARYAVIDKTAQPFLRMLAGTFSRYRRVSDDTYEISSLEVAYFLDYETRELLNKWKNPFTGKDIAVPQVRMGPSRLRLSLKGLDIYSPSGEAVGMAIQHRFDDPVVRGDDTWLTEVITVSGQPPGEQTKPFVYNEMSTYHASLADIEDPFNAWVPTTVEFHNLVTFRPWMGFGDMPGHTTAHASGARAARVEDMPARYLELTEKHHPDVLQDTLRVLEGKAG